MKKSQLILLICFSLSIFFYSCSAKNEQEVNNSIKESISRYMYSYTLNCLNDEKLNNKYYLPDEMKNNLKRYILKDGIIYSFFELLYPNKINELNKLDFYDLYNDDCLWIDSLLIVIEEQKIADQIYELESNLAGVLPSASESNLNSEQIEDNVKQVIKNEVLTYDNKLGYMEYGDEKLVPQIIGNNYVLIHSFNENISREFYDEFFRCYKKEYWKITSGNEELLSTLNILYRGSSYIPLEKNEISKTTRKSQIFNEKGQLIEEKKYSIIEEKEYIKSSLSLKYNNDDKIKESLLTEYKYSTKNVSNLDYTFTKKYIYNYKNDDIPADFDYYENDIIKMKKEYFSDNTYTCQIYFDNGYSVTTYYKNNMPIKEIFSVDNEVERVKIYE